MRLLSSLPGVEFDEAGSSHEALNAIRARVPDVVVLDINLNTGSGLELLRRIHLANSAIRIVMFSMHAEPIYAARAIKAGASGYVCKSAAADELATAVRRVVAGERYIDQDIAGDLAFSPLKSLDDPLESLTNREIEILRLLGDGQSLSGIAETLGIAYKTVANTCTRLKEKLGLERTADLIRVSIESRKG
jgi:DNA-binding NarL/FixJ family response regulator